MARLVHVYDEEVYGENEAFYDADTGKLVHTWNVNDASWFVELEPVFKKYGIKFLSDRGNKFHKKFIAYLEDKYCNEKEE